MEYDRKKDATPGMLYLRLNKYSYLGSPQCWFNPPRTIALPDPRRQRTYSSRRGRAVQFST